MSAAAVGATMLYRSTIGRKIIAALTGLIWIGYVVIHMYGNLKIFLGRDYFNAYAEGLRGIGAPIFGHLHLLSIARAILVAALVLHVWSVYTLWKQARDARRKNYAVIKRVQADSASLYMRWGGTFILLFVIYHLAHFTWGIPVIHPNFTRSDSYNNLVIGFQSVPVVIFYLLAMVALGFHLYHGAWSLFQTLGINNRRATHLIRGFAIILSILVPVGFAIVPLGILFGYVPPA